jgi:WhiB family transcriptional regulator, redox-sensing transcriptional regulator
MRTIRISRPAWVSEASCRGGDPAVIRLFFPAKGNAHRKAIAICADCPVRIPCLEHALDRPELQGIWGGATDDDRDRMRRTR